MSKRVRLKLVWSKLTQPGWPLARSVALVFAVLILGGCADAMDPGSAKAQAHPGAALYSGYCASCHNPGLNGAPQIADELAWKPRIAKGRDLLLHSTINGIGAMPARGLCRSCSDEELGEVVDYMILRAEEAADVAADADAPAEPSV